MIHEQSILDKVNDNFNHTILDVKQHQENVFLFSLVENLPLNSVIVDAGCYNGRTSLYLAKRLKEAKRSDILVIAIDPNLNNILQIQEKSAKLGLNIKTIQSVITNKKSYFKPVKSEVDRGSMESGLRYEVIENYEPGCFVGDSLDNLLSKYPGRIEFLKIDVEGHEKYVLEGSSKTLQRDKPIVYVEIWNNNHAIKRLGEDGNQHTEKILYHLKEFTILQKIEKNYLFRHERKVYR